MIKYGETFETTDLDNNGSTLTLVKKWRNSEVAKTYRKYSVRVKVSSPQQEMAEYIKHTDMIKEKKDSGLLVLKDGEDFMPSFLVEYPKQDQDGSYFVIKSWTEIA
jgi:hypothetical protein